MLLWQKIQSKLRGPLPAVSINEVDNFYDQDSQRAEESLQLLHEERRRLEDPG